MSDQRVAAALDINYALASETLFDAAKACMEAGDIARAGNRNGAIGCAIDVKRRLEAALALVSACEALHQNLPQ